MLSGLIVCDLFPNIPVFLTKIKHAKDKKRMPSVDSVSLIQRSKRLLSDGLLEEAIGDMNDRTSVGGISIEAAINEGERLR